jgi:hypothetical protein
MTIKKDATQSDCILFFLSWRVLLSLSVGHHIDELAALFTGSKYYNAVDECEDSVVFTHTYVQTGVVYCTTLTFDDVTGAAVAATKDFNAQAFAF